MKRIAFLSLLLAFCLVQAVVAQNNSSVPIQSRVYLLGPGDQVKAQVLGEPDFNFEGIVDDAGNLNVPYFDTPVPALCKSEKEMRNDVTKLYGRYLKNPQVTFAVTKRDSRPPVSVGGEVKTPAIVELKRETRLLELISFSNGVTEDAGTMVQIFRSQPPLCGSPADVAEWNAQKANTGDVPSRMYSLLSVKQGSDEANPVIYPGDIVIVQKANPVYMVGEIRSPQGIRIKDGSLSLTTAVPMVGGLAAEARKKDIKIYRLKADSMDREEISANLDLIKTHQQKDLMLEPYDIVEVEKTKKSLASTIMDIAIGSGRTVISGFSGSLPQRVLY